ncbi:MAG: His/Gly/Thr/Pro-type tRNA ligase C-terminal domain-containing protein, partial [Spirochaetes bacterium]|nr:His/Gly/Thr/Pro-type tRNA ligase C-terminal domain-containing protein [Spirochaetota bacterium]
ALFQSGGGSQPQGAYLEGGELPLQAAKEAAAATPPVEKIDTPDVKTIDALCDFMGMSAMSFIKVLVYEAANVELDLSAAPGGSKLQRKKGAGGDVYPQAFFAVAIRGDLDVNEVKLAAVLKASDVRLAADADVTRIVGAPVGFIGTVGLDGLPLIIDTSVTALNCAVTGALEKDKHFKNVAYGRDFQAWRIEDIRTVKAGDRCAACRGELYAKMGNELGHIFKLGGKYTRSMKVGYLDENGKAQVPIMGCYGVGIDRTLASVIEEHHDDAGILWPVSVAPYHVIIIPVKYDGAVKQAADSLAAELAACGIEVLLDDRNERPGVKFNDADLLGIPWRAVIGDKGLAQGQIEIKRRGEKDPRMAAAGNAACELAESVRAELAKFS